MSNYTKTTDFEAKDSLPTGDSGKIIRGAEFETEFDAISTAIATKADTAGPTFTGTLTFETISDGTIGVTAFVDEDDMSSDSATLVPTQQSVKAYVDSQVTAQDLDFQADSGGALSIDLDSETLTFTGGTGVDTSGSGNAVTFAIDSTVATLTGTQTLTNKTLTSPDVNTPDIDGGTIDGTVIGGATPAAVSATTVSATGNITVGGTVDGRDVATDGTKLDGIESGATADQTAAEIRTLVESATDSNVFTDADHTKLDGIEAGATGDQTNAEIRAAVEAATDSNVFTDADHSKLDGIEASADVTDTANVTAAGALMDSEVTNLDQVKAFDSADYATAAQGSTADSALQNVVEDTTPQLGGNLDLNSNDITGTGNIDVTGNVDASLDLLVGGAVAGNAGTRTINVGTAGSVAGGVQIWAGTTQTSFLQFGDDSSISANHYRGYLSYNHSTDTLALGAAGSTKVSVTSTGIDVTGTVVSDGLTVDGAATIGSSTAKTKFYSDSTYNGIYNGSSLTSDESIYMGADTMFFYASGKKRLDINAGGDIQFYEDTGTTAKLFWDASAESLGIGTSSPAYTLHTKSSSGGVALIESTASNSDLYLKDSGTTYNYSNGIGSVGDALRFRSGDGTERMRIDSSGNVGIGTTSPTQSLHVDGQTRFFDSDGTSSTYSFEANHFTSLEIIGDKDASSGGPYTNTVLTNGSNGNLSLRTNGTDRLNITQAGNVGIGTTDPSTRLSVRAGSANGIELDQDSDLATDSARLFFNSSSGGYSIFNTSGSLRFNSGATAGSSSGTERMRIDSSGNVGIGESSPDAKLHIRDATDGGSSSVTSAIQFSRRNGGSNDATIKMQHDGSDGVSNLQFHFGTSETMRIDSSGNVGIGVAPATKFDVMATGANQWYIRNTDGSAQNNAITSLYSGGYSNIALDGATVQLKTSGTERMRLDASGNLLVGTTNTLPGVANTVEGISLYNDGRIFASKSANTTMSLNRSTSDGNILEFRKDGSTVGSIGSRGSGTSFITLKTSSGSGAGLTGTDNGILPMDESALADNNTDLGSSSYRFKDLYLSGVAYASYVGSSGDTDTSIAFDTANSIRFSTAGSEAARFDSSGNLLVGKTSGNAIGTAGIEIDGTNNRIMATRDGNEPLLINRLTSDGTLVDFKKDGTTVGSIGVSSGDLVVGTGVAGVRFNNSGPSLEPRAANGNGNDGGIDLGLSGSRFRNLYLSNSVKNTSGALSVESGGGGQLLITASSELIFSSNAAERARFNTSGNLLVGLTSSDYLAADDGIQLNANGTARFGGSGTSARNLLSFVNGTDGTPAEVGFIQTNGSATSYSTSSDQRLKDNIVDAPSASDDIDAIQVRSFDWKADGSHQKYGMVAQELQSVAPEAVSGDADSDDMMGVDYSKLVPMMLKEIQSLRARVAQLEGAN